METRLRLLLAFARLPRPLAQASLHDKDGRFVGRPDFYYPLQRLALEYDGSGRRENLTSDNRRQNRMVDAGHPLLRFAAPKALSATDSVATVERGALSC